MWVDKRRDVVWMTREDKEHRSDRRSRIHKYRTRASSERHKQRHRRRNSERATGEIAEQPMDEIAQVRGW